ncbi:aminotransferase class I/II-fold pyridoxal phosphate-dependent enzyme [Labedella phragmitis]|uniref:Aminotransferase class I/II-fold pyridoxal phosphate-dependent enzyme n=1 Tax=Labedella phragmitis TaxID=2498849 RepID=A0A3S3Z9L1_9MICO|nr:aminotransferase class I/II-fold pyridoxal phosphate-dependent enzyme [Labedella phragmitis]RWZ51855.1 aminotransferase class I/II-fold pyridoxal phosphate-dependent enzyme [Labedella phragmitis]
MPQLAAHMSSVPESGIRRLFEIALTLDDVNILAVGEPDQPVASHITDAAVSAWRAGETRYTANGGIPDLRRAIVDKLARDNGITAEVEQVWVTIGATQALFQAMGLLLDAGDEILVPDPGYTTFGMNARMLQAVPVPYRLAPEDGFIPDLAQLESLITPQTRVLLINSPSNPLGRVFSTEVLEGLVGLAARHDLWVLSDEVYEYFTFRGEHVSPATLDPDGRVFSVFSLSKTYAMTGVRVGYLVTPPGFAGVMRTVQEAMISCVPTPDQRAAVAALTGPREPVDVALAHYAENAAAAAALLDERGIAYLQPDGAFYLWIDMSHASRGDVASWTERFLLEERVAVAPGSAFGRSGEGWVRVCLAADRARLLDGLRRLPAPGSAARVGDVPSAS